MTQRLDTLQFLRAGHAAGVIGFAVLAAMLGGCTSTGLEGVLPTASQSLPATAPAPTVAQRGTGTVSTAGAEIVDAPVETVAVPPEGVAVAGPKDTGTYPNLNIKPQVANTQITDEEKAAKLEALHAAQADHAATIPTAGKDITDPVLLRKLAAEHAADALKKIQGK